MSRILKQHRNPESPRGINTAMAVLWLLVLVTPLVFSPAAKDNFRLPKLLLSELLVTASLVPLAWRLRDRAAVAPARLVRHPAVLAAAPLAVAASVGLLTSSHPEHVRAALPSLLIALGALVFWSLGLSAAERWQLLRGLAVPGVALAALGILQFHGLFSPFEFEGEVRARLKLTSLAGGAFDLSAYLVLPALVAQACLWRTRSYVWRAVWAVALAVMLYAVAATQTFTSLAALAAGSLALWFFLLPRRRFAAVVGAVLAAGVLVVALVAPLRERAVGTLASLRAGNLDRALTGRPDGWRAALWMLGEHPWVGVGQGAYRAEFAPAKLALVERGTAFFSGQDQPFFSSAHCEPLEVAAEWGLLGVLALVAALTVVVRSLHRELCRGPSRADDLPPPALRVAGCVALAVMSLTAFPLRLALVAYPYLLLLSSVLAREEETL